MTRIRVFYHADDEAIWIDDSALDPVARQVLKGMAPHVAIVMEYAWATFELARGDFDGLNRLIVDASGRMEQQPDTFIRIPKDHTGAAAVICLQDVVANTALWSRLAVEDIDRGDFEGAVRKHSVSVASLTSFTAMLERLTAKDNTLANAALRALGFRCDQVFKPKWEAFVRQVIASGAAPEIGTIKELLRHPDCPPDATQHVTPEKLREWAGKVGFAFRRGAAKKK
jgi:hypothetical protein